jgi:hypothetical protein
MLSIPPSLSSTGKYRRLFFNTEREAKIFASDLTLSQRSRGDLLHKLDQHKLSEALRAYALLRPGQFGTDELLSLLWFDPFAIYCAWRESPVNLGAFTSNLENPSVSSVVGRALPNPRECLNLSPVILSGWDFNCSHRILELNNLEEFPRFPVPFDAGILQQL